MSSMPREALKTSASKPGVIGRAELDAERLGARDDFPADRRCRPA
jgi:hypothetical protein